MEDNIHSVHPVITEKLRKPPNQSDEVGTLLVSKDNIEGHIQVHHQTVLPIVHGGNSSTGIGNSPMQKLAREKA